DHSLLRSPAALTSRLSPYTTLFRSGFVQTGTITNVFYWNAQGTVSSKGATLKTEADIKAASTYETGWDLTIWNIVDGQLPTLIRSEEHTSELQSRENLVCRPLLEEK